MNLHYRDTIDDDETIAAFWDLTPAKLLAKKLTIELPGKPRIVWPDKKALAKLVTKQNTIAEFAFGGRLLE